MADWPPNTAAGGGGGGVDPEDFADEQLAQWDASLQKLIGVTTDPFVAADLAALVAGVTGDLFYRNAAGILVPVAGTKGDGGMVPTGQGDGTVAWETPPAGAVIEDEGTPLTVRSNLNFVGAGVTAADSAGKTVVTIPGGGGAASGVWTPAQNGMLAATADPVCSISAQSIPGAGVLTLSKMQVATAGTVAKLIVQFQGAPAGLTAGQNFVALYKADGTLIAKSADQTAAWGGVSGMIEVSLVVEAGQTLARTAGEYLFAGIYSNGTTRPSLGRAGINQTLLLNYGLGATTYRSATSGATTYTTAPPTTLPTLTANGLMFWMGLAA